MKLSNQFKFFGKNGTLLLTVFFSVMLFFSPKIKALNFEVAVNSGNASEEISIDNIDNITSSSMDLTVKINSSYNYSGKMVDFDVNIVNIDTGVIENKQFTKLVSANEEALLPVNGLDADTEYEFKVRYITISTNAYSSYSAPRRARTLEEDYIDFYKIDNITEHSMDLFAELGDKYGGREVDFDIYVENLNQGNNYHLYLNKAVGNDGKVMFNVIELDPGTEYRFSIRYIRKSDNAYSGYSITRTATTLSGKENKNEKEKKEEEKIDFYKIDNITEDSMDLFARIDEKYAGKKVKFDVRMINLNTGDVLHIYFLEKVANDGGVVFNISDLSPATTYKFKIRYIKELDNKYSQYSLSRMATTLTHLNIPPPNPKKPIITPPSNEPHIPNQPPIIKFPTIGQPFKISFELMAGVVGVIAGVVLSLATSAVPLFASSPNAWKDFFKFTGLFGRRRKNYWGIIFDEETKAPIPAVKVSLFNQAGRKVKTTYSDKFGRYGFFIENGEYSLLAEKDDYSFDKRVDKPEDLYSNVYRGENFRVRENQIVAEEKNIKINIRMKNNKINWKAYAKKKTSQYVSFISEMKKIIFTILYVGGFIITTIATFLSPSLLNSGLLLCYLIVFLYQVIFKRREYGTVTLANGKPAPFVIVKLFKEGSDKISSFGVADVIGRFYLPTDNGRFLMKADDQPVSGVSFKQKKKVWIVRKLMREDLRAQNNSIKVGNVKQ